MVRRLAVVSVVGVASVAGCGGEGRSWTCVPVSESTVCGTVHDGELGVKAGRIAEGQEMRSSSDGARTIVWTGPDSGIDSWRGPIGPTATFSRSPDGELVVETSP